MSAQVTISQLPLALALTGIEVVPVVQNGLTTKTTTQDIANLANSGPSGGVTSFNTRTGAVTLLSSDVTSALGYTAGSVTLVGGTGTVNGLTLTGSVTTSGSLTLGGTLSGIANSALTNSSITINGSSVSLGGSVTVTATASSALTIGTGLSGTSYNGSTLVTIENTGVLSVSGGTTGLTPSTATTGAITLGGTLAVANGGTGTTAPSLVAGTNVTITGTWPNQTINSSGGGGGSGTVTSVAALTLGTSGTDLSSTVANSTTTPVITLNVPTASATNRGVLSSEDWTTFNNKGSGTITSVTGTSPVASSGGTTPAISLAVAYGDTLNPYASKTANYFLAAPNGSAGVPTFRVIVASDIPTLDQDTTGTAAKATNIAAGAANRILYQTGANATSFIAAPTTASTYLGWNGSAFTWGTVSATVNWAVPGTIGSTTPNTGAFTYLSFINATTSYKVIFDGGSGYLDSFIGVVDETPNGRGKTSGYAYNAIYDPDYGAGTGIWVYENNGGASYISLQEDSINFWAAPTGTAGNPLSGAFLAITSTGVNAQAAFTTTSSIKSTSTSAGVGYATGAGGTQTQSTSKSTGVTLNKICGAITMSGVALAATTSVSFTLTNSSIAATDVVIVNIASAATTNTYVVTVDAVASGSCRIHLRNISATSRSEALVLNFAVIKSVTA
jgi:hypothetical protein